MLLKIMRIEVDILIRLRGIMLLVSLKYWNSSIMRDFSVDITNCRRGTVRESYPASGMSIFSMFFRGRANAILSPNCSHVGKNVAF